MNERMEFPAQNPESALPELPPLKKQGEKSGKEDPMHKWLWLGSVKDHLELSAEERKKKIRETIQEEIDRGKNIQ